MRHVNEIMRQSVTRTDDMFRAGKHDKRNRDIEARNRAMRKINIMLGTEYPMMEAKNERR